MAITAQGAELKYGSTALLVEKMCPIKDVPEMYGAPEMIETTDLDNEQQTYIFGIATNGLKEFTANYDKVSHAAMKATSRTPGFYEIAISDGSTMTFQGEHVVGFPGAGVNGVLEQKIYIAPSTPITYVAGALEDFK